MQATATSFEEIRAVTRLFPREDTAMRAEVRQRLADIALAQGSTGFLGNLAFWLATAQRRGDPQITHPRVALFARDARHREGFAGRRRGGNGRSYCNFGFG